MFLLRRKGLVFIRYKKNIFYAHAKNWPSKQKKNQFPFKEFIESKPCNIISFLTVKFFFFIGTYLIGVASPYHIKWE